jgi:hypothetical protein
MRQWGLRARHNGNGAVIWQSIFQRRKPAAGAIALPDRRLSRPTFLTARRHLFIYRRRQYSPGPAFNGTSLSSWPR